MVVHAVANYRKMSKSISEQSCTKLAAARKEFGLLLLTLLLLLQKKLHRRCHLNHPSFAMLVRSKFARGIEAGCRRCWWKATVGCNTATGRGWGQFLWMVMKVLRMMSLGDADARA